jgi:hypothetical protein
VHLNSYASISEAAKAVGIHRGTMFARINRHSGTSALTKRQLAYIKDSKWLYAKNAPIQVGGGPSAAVAGAEEKEREEYYLIPKNACRECGKRLPLKVTKTKYKNEAVRNKVRLGCANQECRGRRGAPFCTGWDIWEGAEGEGGCGSGHSKGAPKRAKHDKILVDTDSDEDVLMLQGIMRLSKGELHARHPWTQHVIFNETIMPEDSKEEVERLVQRVKEVRPPL